MSTSPLESRVTAAGYDKQPTVPLPEGERVVPGDAVWQAAMRIASSRGGDSPLITVDVYPGGDVPGLMGAIRAALPDAEVIDVEEAAARPAGEISALISRNLTDDRVFGVMGRFTVDEFYDRARVAELADRVSRRERATVLVGWGADLVAGEKTDALVLVDLARWEIQQRQRAGAPNWRAGNGDEEPLRKYKRGFFVEWRTADRHKRSLFDRVDLVVDGSAEAGEGGAITGDAFRGALRGATRRPFRVVPFFDPGVWGGQWMKQKLGLDPSAENYAWCFDCVPEENSLLLADDSGARVEIPALDLVLMEPRGLLGERTFARFGAEFPIRFDFLDTMGGGNLSLQVHPLAEYIRDTFGMTYTQDESYYLLDAGEDAVVYLGTKPGVDPDEMLGALRRAADGGEPFDADRFVNSFPARTHDHFHIPAGTVHCSGANSMVLEISATPFIFTFKLWDWGRVGLDGVPRPVHLDHGGRNIQWERDRDWVERNLVDRVERLRSEPGLVEERTGLHELEFIEVRRHWFDVEAAHDTAGTLNVLNLVEGDEAEIVSPDGLFEPFAVHYAETVIVPADAGRYVVRRAAGSRSERFATVKATVRGTARTDH